MRPTGKTDLIWKSMETAGQMKKKFLDGESPEYGAIFRAVKEIYTGGHNYPRSAGTLRWSISDVTESLAS